MPCRWALGMLRDEAQHSSGGAVGDLEGANSSASLLKSENGGTLIFHENLDGHTLRRHVGKTDTELLARFQTEPDILDSSTYPNLEMAQRVVGETLQAQQA